jgi:hypothetical protein
VIPAHRPLPSAQPFSLLLRLLPQYGVSGRVVGHAEVVATGEVVVITGAQDLLDLVTQLSIDAGE